MKELSVSVLLGLISIICLQGCNDIYCNYDNYCVTIMDIEDQAYLVPGVYRSSRLPDGPYIHINNYRDIDIIWPNDSDSILIFMSRGASSHNASMDNDIRLVDYYEDYVHNDSTFTEYIHSYRRYSESIRYISIFTRDRYAINSRGERVSPSR